jgi:hypothetical protein
MCRPANIGYSDRKMHSSSYQFYGSAKHLLRTILKGDLNTIDIRARWFRPAIICSIPPTYRVTRDKILPQIKDLAPSVIHRKLVYPAS